MTHTRAFCLAGAVLTCSILAFAQLSPSLTEYATPTASSSPEGITVGPDGALWFTEFTANKIGRISTAGDVQRVHDTHRVQRPLRDHRGAGRRALVYRVRRQQDRADHHRGCDHRISRSPRPTASPRASRRGRMARCGSPKTAATRSGGSPPPGRSPSIPVPTAGSDPDGITAGPDGALWFTELERQQDRADHHGGGHHRVSRFPRLSSTPSASRRGRMARCGSPRTPATRSDGSPPPGRSPSTRYSRREPNPLGSPRDRTGPCGLQSTRLTSLDGSPRPEPLPST